MCFSSAACQPCACRGNAALAPGPPLRSPWNVPFDTVFLSVPSACFQRNENTKENRRESTIFQPRPVREPAFSCLRVAPRPQCRAFPLNDCSLQNGLNAKRQAVLVPGRKQRRTEAVFAQEEPAQVLPGCPLSLGVARAGQGAPAQRPATLPPGSSRHVYYLQSVTKIHPCVRQAARGIFVTWCN